MKVTPIRNGLGVGLDEGELVNLSPEQNMLICRLPSSVSVSPSSQVQKYEHYTL
jgi:hypothetical protein